MLVLSLLEKKKSSILVPGTSTVLAACPPKDSTGREHGGLWTNTELISHDLGPRPSWLPAMVTGLVWRQIFRLQALLLNGPLCQPPTPLLLSVASQGEPSTWEAGGRPAAQAQGEGKTKWEKDRRGCRAVREVTFGPSLRPHVPHK